MSQDTRFIGITDYWDTRTSHVALEGGGLKDGYMLSAGSFGLTVKGLDLFIRERESLDPGKSDTKVLIPAAFIE